MKKKVAFALFLISTLAVCTYSPFKAAFPQITPFAAKNRESALANSKAQWEQTLQKAAASIGGDFPVPTFVYPPQPSKDKSIRIIKGDPISGFEGRLLYATSPIGKQFYDGQWHQENTIEQVQSLKNLGVDPKSWHKEFYESRVANTDSWFGQSGRSADVWCYIVYPDNADKQDDIYQLSLNGGQYIMRSWFIAESRILLQLGWPYDVGNPSGFFLMDLNARQVRPLGSVTNTLDKTSAVLSPSKRFLAYLSGTKANGEIGQLIILDIEQNQEKIVSIGLSLRHSRYSWTPQDVLICSTVANSTEEAKKSVRTRWRVFPNIR